MAAKITADKIKTEMDGWSVLSGRFRVHAVKCGPGVVISPGPNASPLDASIAQSPDLFTSLDSAIRWLEPRVP